MSLLHWSSWEIAAIPSSAASWSTGHMGSSKCAWTDIEQQAELKDLEGKCTKFTSFKVFFFFFSFFFKLNENPKKSCWPTHNSQWHYCWLESSLEISFDIKYLTMETNELSVIQSHLQQLCQLGSVLQGERSLIWPGFDASPELERIQKKPFVQSGHGRECDCGY